MYLLISASLSYSEEQVSYKDSFPDESRLILNIGKVRVTSSKSLFIECEETLDERLLSSDLNVKYVS